MEGGEDRKIGGIFQALVCSGKGLECNDRAQLCLQEVSDMTLEASPGRNPDLNPEEQLPGSVDSLGLIQ